MKFKQVLSVHFVFVCNFRRSLRNSSRLTAQYSFSSGLTRLAGTSTGLKQNRDDVGGTSTLGGSNLLLSLQTKKQVAAARRLFAKLDPWVFELP